MTLHPGFLLVLARQQRGVSGLDADELREVARHQWPKLDAAEIDRRVEAALEYRDQTERRIDPATVDLQHPAERTGTMPSATKLKQFVADLIEDDPEISYDEINREARKRFDTHISQHQTSAIARHVRAELDEGPAADGAKPEPPKDPSAGDAEPDASQATEPVEGTALATTGEEEESEVNNGDVTTLDDWLQLQLESLEDRGVARFIAPPRTDRVQVDAEPGTGRARLFIDVETDIVTAYNLAALVNEQLAEAAAEAA